MVGFLLGFPFKTKNEGYPEKKTETHPVFCGSDRIGSSGEPGGSSGEPGRGGTSSADVGVGA